MYKDPEDIMQIFDQPDFEGNSCFHYIKEFDLHRLMNIDSLQDLIDQRWNGMLVLNSSTLEFSTAYKLWNDKYGLYKSNKKYKQLRDDVFNFDLSNQLHLLKFTSWQKSMMLRSQIESISILIMTILFTVYIN